MWKGLSSHSDPLHPRQVCVGEREGVIWVGPGSVWLVRVHGSTSRVLMSGRPDRASPMSVVRAERGATRDPCEFPGEEWTVPSKTVGELRPDVRDLLPRLNHCPPQAAAAAPDADRALQVRLVVAVVVRAPRVPGPVGRSVPRSSRALSPSASLSSGS